MAISFVGQASAAAPSVALPAHQPGDLIVIWAYQGTSNATTIALPSGYTAAASQSGTGANAQASRLGFRIATSNAETSGDWTGAEEVIAHVYRGVDQANPIGGSSTMTAIADVTFAAVALAVTDGSSWVAAFAGWRTSSSNLATATFPGLGLRGNINSGTVSRAATFDTGSSVTSFPGTSSSGATGFRYRTAALELRAAATTGAGATGSSASTLATLAAASATSVAIIGAASLALAGIVSSGAARATASGAGATTIATIASTSGSSIPLAGSGAKSLGAIGSTATGALPVAGAAAGSLAPIGSLSGSRADVSASASAALGSVTAVAVAGGQQVSTASSASSLGSISAAASANLPTTGSSAARLDDLSSSGGSVAGLRGAGTATLGDIASTSFAIIPSLASATAAIGLVSGSATGSSDQGDEEQLVGPGWTLAAAPRRFAVSAAYRSFTVSSTGCKRMLNFPPKYAHEVRNAVVDFAPALSEGEALTGQPTVAIMKGDLTVTGARIEGTAVHFKLSGGTSAAKVVQWVEVHCPTDGDQVLEEVVSVTMLS